MNQKFHHVVIVLVLGTLFAVFVSCRQKPPEKHEILLLFTPEQASDKKFKGKLEFWIRDASGQVLSNERVEIFFGLRNPADVEGQPAITQAGSGTLPIVSNVTPLQVKLKVNGVFLLGEDGKPKEFNLHFPSREGDSTPTPATVDVTQVKKTIQVFISTVPGQEGKRVEEREELKAGSYHYLMVRETPPEQPENNRSEITYELIHPRKALLRATFRNSSGDPIADLPVEIQCSTLGDNQIHPSLTQTDKNGIVFSVIEAPPGVDAHTIRIVPSNGPTFQETIQFQIPRGTLVVTSQPSNASVYLNREAKGKTPLVLSLDREQQYTLVVKKPGYHEPKPKTIAFKDEQPVRENYILESVKITGMVRDDGTKEPVAGAIVTIAELQYRTITDVKGQFEFSDWETYRPLKTEKKYKLSISDPQGRFRSTTREFDLDSITLDDITVQSILTVSVYVTDTFSSKPLSAAQVTVNGQPAQAGNQDGSFVAEVTDLTKPISIQVGRKGYETPQGKSVYTLQIPPNVQNSFVSVPLFPLLFSVELPPDWEIPQKPGIRFVAKSSLLSKEEIQGKLDGRRVIFPYAPFLVAGRRVHVEMRQSTMLLEKGRGLEVKKYERIQP